MASRIYAESDIEDCIDYRNKIHENNPVCMIRYWKHDDWTNDLDTIFPIIAKGNVFQGIEAMW